jgi:predicted HicB family RNase H-like nuclease
MIADVPDLRAEGKMARKTNTEKEAVPSVADPKTKPVRLDLEPDVHQMLRVVAAEQGKPMAVFAREVVEETVRKMYGERRRG